MSRKLVVYMIPILLAGGLGAALVFAQSSSPATQSQTQSQEADQNPSITGSIAIPATPQGEAAEATAYQELATVTLEQAVQAAQTNLGVTTAPTSAQLDNENGFLIWEVVLGDQVVKVDAGNAEILQVTTLGDEAKAEESAESNEHGDKGGNEGEEGFQHQDEGGQSDADTGQQGED